METCVMIIFQRDVVRGEGEVRLIELVLIVSRAWRLVACAAEM